MVINKLLLVLFLCFCFNFAKPNEIIDKINKIFNFIQTENETNFTIKYKPKTHIEIIKQKDQDQISIFYNYNNNLKKKHTQMHIKIFPRKYSIYFDDKSSTQNESQVKKFLKQYIDISRYKIIKNETNKLIKKHKKITITFPTQSLLQCYRPKMPIIEESVNIFQKYTTSIPTIDETQYEQYSTDLESEYSDTDN